MSSAKIAITWLLLVALFAWRGWPDDETPQLHHITFQQLGRLSRAGDENGNLSFLQALLTAVIPNVSCFSAGSVEGVRG